VGVTSAHVAEVAGVSPSTVSRVFLSPDQVTADTRERVLAVARRLGYSPNRAARSLATGRTGAVGLIVPDVSNPFFAEIVKAVQARVRHRDRAVLMADSDENADDERAIALAMARQVDGLIMVSPRCSDRDLRDVDEAVPLVLANRAAPGVPAVVAPSADGMRQAVQHLAALGHQRCCYLNVGPRSWSNGQRVAAVRQTCDDLRVGLVELGPFAARYEGGAAAVDEVRASGATAVIAHNDMMAIGVMSSLQRHRLDVPGHLSVVGVDDTVLAAVCNPGLTSVRIPLDEMGTQAVDLLIDRMGGAARADRPIELETGLVVRESTGPTPALRAARTDLTSELVIDLAPLSIGPTSSRPSIP
jgi:DNA-binding LacI/PurR family transcriptional regulator